MKKHKISMERLVQGVAAFILFVLIFFMIHFVNDIQGTARVVNYAGLVRGATQRMVKLEISGVESPGDIETLDGYLDGIQNGSDQLDLVRIPNKKYQEKVEELSKAWTKLKEEVKLVRIKGAANTDILTLSEEYFELSDDVVDLAEKYSQECASMIQVLEIVIIAIIAFLVIMMIKESIGVLRVRRANRELKKKVYIDEQTGLPNRNQCEAILEDGAILKETTCCFMFDLNNLKYINDHFGHSAGDRLIENFASLIRRSVPDKYLVARYGGDEFIVILTSEYKLEPETIIKHVRENVDQYNRQPKVTTISYAAGYACSCNMDNCTLRTLLAKADTNMYADKKRTKEKKYW